MDISVPGCTWLQVCLSTADWCGGKESTYQYRRSKRLGFSLWMGKMPWRRGWQPTPGFLPGKPHGQRSLAATVHVLQSQTWLTDWAQACVNYWIIGRIKRGEWATQSGDELEGKHRTLWVLKCFRAFLSEMVLRCQHVWMHWLGRLESAYTLMCLTHRWNC